MFTNDLLAAHADVSANVIDFDEYKNRLEAVLDAVEAQSDADKARAFDKVFASLRSCMLEEDEFYDGHMMYEDGDNTHYVWEDLLKATFGPKVFDFWNKAYSGG